MSRPDIEKELVLAFEELPGIRAGTVTPKPDKFEAVLATNIFVRVGKLSGLREEITDFPVVDIDVFGLKRDDVFDTAEVISAFLAPRRRLVSAIIDNVRVNVSPRRLPWDNDRIIRFSATYIISVRR